MSRTDDTVWARIERVRSLARLLADPAALAPWAAAYLDTVLTDARRQQQRDRLAGLSHAVLQAVTEAQEALGRDLTPTECDHLGGAIRDAWKARSAPSPATPDDAMTELLSDARIAEISARLDAAPDWPWELGPDGDIYTVYSPDGEHVAHPSSYGASALIEHAPRDLSDLLDDRRSLKEERDALLRRIAALEQQLATTTAVAGDLVDAIVTQEQEHAKP